MTTRNARDKLDNICNEKHHHRQSNREQENKKQKKKKEVRENGMGDWEGEGE